MNLQKLKTIESDFQQLLLKDRRNWVKAAKLLFQIEEEELFKARFPSFTQYVLWLAKENKVNPSTLWRAKSSARLYAELTFSEGVHLLNESSVKTTPEQLEYFGKVQTIAPALLVEEVKEKMLKGEQVRHELKRLWNVYKPLKAGKTERGRKPKDFKAISRMERLAKQPDQFKVPYTSDEEKENQAIAQTEYVHLLQDKFNMERYQVEESQMTEANFKHALLHAHWMKSCLENPADFTYFTAVDVPVYESDNVYFDQFPVMGMAKLKAGKNAETLVFNTLLEVVPQFDWTYGKKVFCEYAHFSLVGIPFEKSMVDRAMKVVPDTIGIIVIGKAIERKGLNTELIRPPKFRRLSVEKEITLYKSLLSERLEWK